MKRHGVNTLHSIAHLLHSAPSSQERVRGSESVHKETLHYEITNTRISGVNSISGNQFADYDLAGRGLIATGAQVALRD